MNCRQHGVTLTFGCSECIDRVKVDQRRAGYAEWADDQLYDEWTTNPLGPDDELVATLLVERGVLTVEEAGVVSADVLRGVS